MAKGDRGSTLYWPATKQNKEWLDKHCQASTGPYPCISGMRNLYPYWRRGTIVKCGVYIYLFPSDIPLKVRGFGA